MLSLALWLLSVSEVWANPLIRKNEISQSPTVTISKEDSNTIFVGRTLPQFDQDVFLGIKYANEPARFTAAELKTSYVSNDSDSGVYDLSLAKVSPALNSVYYNSTTYGHDCPGYGTDNTNLISQGLVHLDEDCLNLNVIRPNTNGKALPVLLWIFGGGWQQGDTADPRYNLSYVVQQSVLNENPVIGVSINYRMAAFGFLDSEEVRAEGNTNLGLRDQRIALHWVKQNIKAFGGDPDKITIWGESAGAYSVGIHLLINGGDNEGLFRAAIMESGNAVGPPYNGTEWHQPMYDRIVERTGCENATNTLLCLRDLPYKTFYDNAYEGLEWFATIDNSFITKHPQISYREGNIAKVPLLLGSNTDEGTSFGTTGVDTDKQCIEQMITSKRWVISRENAEKILSLYPNTAAIGCPYGWGNVTWPKLGLQYKRYASIAGDLTMAAPRRLLAQSMSRFVNEIYSYRWDVAAFNHSTSIGVGHFAEIPFVFSNPVQNITTLASASDPRRLELGHLAARMWSSFATDLDPNGHGISDIPQWPHYTSNATNFVFRLPRDESYVELDTDRAAGISYINSIMR